MLNTLKTGILLVAMAALLLFMGQYFGGQQGVMIAGVVALLMSFGSYWFSDKIVLKMYRAQPVNPAQAPDLHQMVERLAQRAEIPTPRLYIVPTQSPNAFATGRSPKHGVVAVTEGLLRMMSHDELEGVIAHEMGHIKNRDTLVMVIVATLAQAIMMLRMLGFFMGNSNDNRRGGGEALLMFFLAPVVAMIIQLAISRTREYKADASAAHIVGHPQGLINALRKLSGYGTQRDLASNPAAQHLFIANPFAGSGIAKLFSTHPSTEDRVRKLSELV